MSDGRFSSKPIRTGRRSDFGRGEFSAEAMPSTDVARAFIRSPAVQREVNALMDEPFPDAGDVKCAPFPKNTPRGAMDLGRPIASAVLVQEHLAGLIFLRICGWGFMLVGGLFVLIAVIGAIAMAFEPPRANRDKDAPFGMIVVAGIGLGVMGAGAWFGIFRGRFVHQMCWFCPRGMVWMTNSAFEWYVWEEVPEVYCKQAVPRPAVGVGFGGEIAWISFSNTPASRLIVDYIENRASAAWMPEMLQMIAEGRPVRLGDWRLRWASIDGPRDRVEWKNVIDVARKDRDLVIHQAGRGGMTIPLDEIPFPSLATTLARAAWAHAKERP